MWCMPKSVLPNGDDLTNEEGDDPCNSVSECETDYSAAENKTDDEDD